MILQIHAQRPHVTPATFAQEMVWVDAYAQILVTLRLAKMAAIAQKMDLEDMFVTAQILTIAEKIAPKVISDILNQFQIDCEFFNMKYSNTRFSKQMYYL